MKTERAIEILHSYGGQAMHWPDDERQALKQLIAESTDLQIEQKRALQLDYQLQSLQQSQPEPDCSDLAERILNALPPQTSKTSTVKKWHWNLSRLQQLLFPPALVLTSLALVLVYRGMDMDRAPGATEPSAVVQLSSEEWQMLYDAVLPADDLELMAELEPELWDEIEAI